MGAHFSIGWDDAAVLHVCRHLRARDVAEVFATRAEVDGWALYVDLRLHAPNMAWFEVVRAEAWGLPVAVMGVMRRWPGVGSAFLLGTDGFTIPIAREVADMVRLRMRDGMAEAGMHRVDCQSLASYRAAHRFLERCGAKPEGYREAIGKEREDFIDFVWVADKAQSDGGALTVEKLMLAKKCLDQQED